MMWATRRGCHVDRTACIWLIRRFLDPEADFSFFGDPAEAPEGAELFDVVGARLSHREEDCSFETFLKEYGLEDRVLREIAEIVHDADLMDEKYGRPESEGLDAIVRGEEHPASRYHPPHRAVLGRGLPGRGADEISGSARTAPAGRDGLPDPHPLRKLRRGRESLLDAPRRQERGF